ncbi:hypothetical protein BZA77DRAFT_313741 [Pyronema omphalodes]|nr:hypothetical protein BZA77DRAFT_313741 [Pyronema omphalodes]
MVFIKNIAIAFVLIVSSALASPMPEAEADPQLKACYWKGCASQSVARCDPGWYIQNVDKRSCPTGSVRLWCCK